jgi:hypothetical protein
MWEQLQVATTGSVGKLSRSTISLASLCSNTDPKKKRNTDLVRCNGSSSRSSSSSCRDKIAVSSLLAVRVHHAVPLRDASCTKHTATPYACAVCSW